MSMLINGVELFENDVKMYGIQTVRNGMPCSIWFENDVKMYGIQTLQMISGLAKLFENDVKMYDIQTEEYP